MVKNTPSNAVAVGSVHRQGTKFPHSLWKLNSCVTTTELKGCNQDLYLPLSQINGYFFCVWYLSSPSHYHFAWLNHTHHEMQCFNFTFAEIFPKPFLTMLGLLFLLFACLDPSLCFPLDPLWWLWCSLFITFLSHKMERKLKNYVFIFWSHCCYPF